MSFGRPPVVRAVAPGRVNLIGEHTDYNGGFVLPMPIPQCTRVELAPRPDRTVQVQSVQLPEAPLRYALGDERPGGGGWGAYVQGVTWVLTQAGARLGGFDARIDSSVPVGSGLSSSAALTVGLLRALREAFRLGEDDVGLALLAQRVECDFVGAPVGIMDPMAVSVGRPGEALFLDTQRLVFERVALPAGLELAVVDSGVRHAHAGGEYARRRAECEEAARRLGVGCLRALTEADLARVEALPPPLDRRARHVVTEDARVLAAVEALRAGDGPRLGRLFDASHASLSEDFEVSCPAVDTLVALAREEPGVLGARMTGGGFGGCVVILTRPGAGRAVAAATVRRYREVSGREGAALLP